MTSANKIPVESRLPSTTKRDNRLRRNLKCFQLSPEIEMISISIQTHIGRSLVATKVCQGPSEIPLCERDTARQHPTTHHTPHPALAPSLSQSGCDLSSSAKVSLALRGARRQCSPVSDMTLGRTNAMRISSFPSKEKNTTIQGKNMTGWWM